MHYILFGATIIPKLYFLCVYSEVSWFGGMVFYATFRVVFKRFFNNYVIIIE